MCLSVVEEAIWIQYLKKVLAPEEQWIMKQKFQKSFRLVSLILYINYSLEASQEVTDLSQRRKLKGKEE